MAASKLSSCLAMAIAAAAMPTLSNRAYADGGGGFRFSPFSSSSSAPKDPSSSGASESEAEEPRGSGMDPEALERAAKALREINNSKNSKQIFDVMKKQEQTRQTELSAEKAHFQAQQAHADIERQRKMAEEQRNLVQQDAQRKAQVMRYEDELARKRMQTEHETQRQHNIELVKMQEESSLRKERARQATEEQIQAQQRQTEKERADLERETIRVKAIAEAEGRAHEAKLTEDQNRRLLIERMNGEKEKWLAAINTAFSHIEGGFRTLLTDRNKLVMTVGGATALAAGVYTTRFTEHETQRQHNIELVKMQEESSLRKERARQATEEQIQAQQRQTEKERADLERETIRVKAIAEAEGRAHEAKLTEDQNRRLLIERMNGEKEKWLAAINTAFSHIEGGFRTLLTDRNKLVMTVGGATALAAGVYTTREGSRVIWGYVNRILGQPSLIRESSIARFPGSEIISQAKNKVLNYSTAAAASGSLKNGLGNIVLHPSLQRRIEQLARATANTKAHQAPFRNMMFYGPPGTGKTMVAREIARKSGLDYAMMTGGDVAPLGAQAVTKIHQIFDWAKKSNKGLLLFIDEADAFLCERNSTHMSEAQRSALNALLFRTGDQSRDIVLVLATNRPGDLDSAITDRIDEVIEFPLPGEEERFKLLKLYLIKYLSSEDNTSKWGSLYKKQSQKITMKGVSDDVIREAAQKTEGFSGREIAKLMAGVQAAVYGRPDCVLDSQLFKEIVDYKVAEHHQRIKLAAEGDGNFSLA